MILALLGCAARTPPVLFPAPAVHAPPPEPVSWETAPDECLSGAAFKTNHPPPFVLLDDDGAPYASCRAQLVPETRFAELLSAESDGIYWREIAGVCTEGRDRDRLYAQQAYEEAWRAGDAAARDLRAQRWSTGGALVLGFAVGVGTTYAVTKIAVDALE